MRRSCERGIFPFFKITYVAETCHIQRRARRPGRWQHTGHANDGYVLSWKASSLSIKVFFYYYTSLAVPFVGIRKIVYGGTRAKDDDAHRFASYTFTNHPCSTLHTRIIDRLTCCEYLFDSKHPPTPIAAVASLLLILPIFSLYIIMVTTLAATLPLQKRRIDFPPFRFTFIER